MARIVGQDPDGELRTTSPTCDRPTQAAALAVPGATAAGDVRDRVPLRRPQPHRQLLHGGGRGLHGGWLNLPPEWVNRVSSTLHGCARIRHFDSLDLVSPSQMTIYPGRQPAVPEQPHELHPVPALSMQRENVAPFGQLEVVATTGRVGPGPQAPSDRETTVVARSGPGRIRRPSGSSTTATGRRSSGGSWPTPARRTRPPSSPPRPSPRPWPASTASIPPGAPASRGSSASPPTSTTTSCATVPSTGATGLATG